MVDLMEDALAEALVVLEKCEKQFTFYADEHRKQDKHEKAATNLGYALIAGRALEHLRIAIRSRAPTEGTKIL